jgi:hypothetical protein
MMHDTDSTPARPDAPADDDRPGVSFTREQIEAWAGHPLTDDEVSALEDTLPLSSLPEVVATVAFSLFPTEDDDR